jgi:hypothetical protein
MWRRVGAPLTLRCTMHRAICRRDETLIPLLNQYRVHQTFKRHMATDGHRRFSWIDNSHQSPTRKGYSAHQSMLDVNADGDGREHAEAPRRICKAVALQRAWSAWFRRYVYEK